MVGMGVLVYSLLLGSQTHQHDAPSPPSGPTIEAIADITITPDDFGVSPEAWESMDPRNRDVLLTLPRPFVESYKNMPFKARRVINEKMEGKSLLIKHRQAFIDWEPRWFIALLKKQIQGMRGLSADEKQCVLQLADKLPQETSSRQRLAVLELLAADIAFPKIETAEVKAR